MISDMIISVTVLHALLLKLRKGLKRGVNNFYGYQP